MKDLLPGKTELVHQLILLVPLYIFSPMFRTLKIIPRQKCISNLPLNTGKKLEPVNASQCWRRGPLLLTSLQDQHDHNQISTFPHWKIFTNILWYNTILRSG